MKRFAIALILLLWASLTFQVGAAWDHEAEVDALLEGAMAEFDIPGMSVVVIDDGEVVYSRGFGYADLSPFKAALPTTVYRLASVSKAVGGVLALDLQEQGKINLNKKTRDYVPGLPAFHTHRVWHTIANRSGFGHYTDFPEPPLVKYTDALTPLKSMWNTPLLYTPGQGYKYSTHGYTALGAAIEAATGKKLTPLIAGDFNDVYGLPTLRVENRQIFNANRSQLYTWKDGGNVEVTPDHISWKVLGGGLEASALDMARFGMKLMDGDILTPASLDKLWTPPDNLNNYAYGWNTAWETCTAVVAKNGGQTGANSYLRVYPTRGISIAVLTNRWKGGHSATTLGREIGKIMLEDECQYTEQELLKNRSFEQAATGDPKLAKNWIGMLLEDDQRVVNKRLRRFARTGKAAFRFNGEGPFLSAIRQDVNDINLVPGDRLILSGWIKASKMENTPRLSVELNNDDGSNSQFLLVGDIGTYGYRKYVKEIIVTKPADSLHMLVAILDEPGTFYVDDVSLYLIREGGSSALLSVPAAPAAPGERLDGSNANGQNAGADGLRD